jgi:outer membrane receptor protein involved in Fe transport
VTNSAFHLKLFLLYILLAWLPTSQADDSMAADEETIVIMRERLPVVIAEQGIDAQEIDNIFHDHVQELLTRTPSVSMHRGSGQESLLAIRSPVLTGAGACGAFLVMEDDIPVRPAGFCNVNQLFEVHTEQAGRVDVSAGPDTVFYGSNALHGALNFSTPAIANNQNSLSFKLAEDDNYQVRWRQSARHDDQGYLLAVTLKDDGGFRVDTGLEEQKLTAKYWLDTGLDSELIFGLTTTQLRQETAGFITGQDAYKDEQSRKSNENPEAYRDADATRLWLKYRKTLDDNQELVITPYLRNSDMTFLMHFLPGQPTESNDQTSYGVMSTMYQDVTDRWWLSYGVDVEYSEGSLLQFQSRPYDASDSAFLRATLPQGRQYDYTVDARQMAAFIQSEWQVSDSLRYRLGYRFERLDYDYDNLMNNGRLREDGTECGFGGCRYSRPADRADDFSEGNWVAGVVHNVSDNQTIQVNVSRGHRAPQATELYRLQRQQTVAELDAVSMTAYEISYRYQANNWQLQFTLFDMEKDNVIYRDIDFFNRSNGQTSHQGLEWQLNYQISEAWELTAQGAFADHEYLNTALISGESIVGNQVDTAPEHYGSAQLRWQAEQDQVIIDVQYMGDYYLDLLNEFKYEGHQLLHLHWLRELNRSWQLGIHLLNATNTAYAERADYTSFSGYRYFPGLDRRLQLDIRLRY